MKKEFLNLLKITATRHSKPVRLYSSKGHIWAHRIGNGYDLRQRLVETDRLFDVCVDGNFVKGLLGLEKTLSMAFDGEIHINGQTVSEIDLPELFKPVDEARAENDSCTFEIDEDRLGLIYAAAQYISKDDTRPLFNHVYIDKDSITATNTYILYTSLHGKEGVEKPLFIPKDLLPFLAPGALSVRDTGAEENPRQAYEFKAEDREGFWSLPVMQFPDYKRLIDGFDNPLCYDFKTGKGLAAEAEKLSKLAKLKADISDNTGHPVISLGDVLGRSDIDKRVSGTYLPTVLKTIGNRAFCLFCSEVKNTPMLFDVANDRILLTPIRE